jgi:hypothetical protein
MWRRRRGSSRRARIIRLRRSFSRARPFWDGRIWGDHTEGTKRASRGSTAIVLPTLLTKLVTAFSE